MQEDIDAASDPLIAPLLGFNSKGRLILGSVGARRAIVFVHGFCGHPSRTWRDCIPHGNHLATRDIYLYGYESVFQRAYTSALGLLEFLRKLSEEPAEYVDLITGNASGRGLGWKYQDITIVAHSLGAVVSRLAVVEGTRAGLPLTPVQLVLLAPAHMGTNVIGLAREALGSVRIQFVAPLAVFTCPVLDDLQESSSILGHLRARCSGKPELSAQEVAIAENDRVVIPTPFPGDPVSKLMRHHSHMSITKPLDDDDDVARLLTSIK
jgi:hypothetical protein